MLEKWNSRTSAGDVLYRDQLLGEIKTNMINVISDYKDLGVNNELALIARTNTLFTGDVIPSRKDWETLNYVLKELSTVKEQGQMYNHFIRDVSDSLGISDLEKIKEFIDYIQTLPPITASIRIQMDAPEMYGVTNLRDSTTDNWAHTNLNWGLSSNYLKKPQARISFTSSSSEDISKYVMNITAGSFSQRIERSATNTSTHTLELDWLNWFPVSQLKNVKLTVNLEVIDKRGNTTETTQSATYPASVVIPQGIDYYEVGYQLDGKNWKVTGRPKVTTHRFKMPRINGNYTWWARAHDKSGTKSKWVETPPRWIRYIPDPPAKPSPTVTTTVREAIISWKPVARAEYYEVWHGGEGWAKDNNNKNGNRYWSRVNAGSTLRVTHQKMNEGKKYTWYVRAVNEGGSNTGSVAATQKKYTVKTKTYRPTGTNVWRGGYHRIWKNWSKTWYGAKWRYSNSKKHNNIYQGAWHDANWGGWAARSGGSYWAHGGQKWGNNASYIYFDYDKIRKDLKGKNIQSVTITLTRKNSIHGWATGKPLYLYNHNKTTAQGPGNIDMYRRNRTRVSRSNQEVTQHIKFARGQTEVVVNQNTKQLWQNIINGHMKGLGIVYYYGANFNSNPPVAPVNYMYFNGNIKVDVKYKDG